MLEENVRDVKQAVEKTKDRGGVQSIARAFSIIEEIARNREGISLSDLSKRVNLHNSTTFHLVKTMVSLGYVRQEKNSKLYRVGRPLFALAASSLDEIEMVSLALPILEELAHQTGESCHFAVRMGSQVLILAEQSGEGFFQMASRAGAVRPAYCTALGKVLLAAMTPHEFQRYLGTTTLDAYTPNTIVTPEALAEGIEDVRKTGVAYDDGEFNTEGRCIAMPVFDFTNHTIGAIGLSGPIWRLPIQKLQEKVDIIRAGAVKLSTEFGWSAPDQG